MSIAGRLECAISVEEVFVPMMEVCGGECNDRSSMKFPVARFAGVRGRFNDTLTSYCWRDARSDPRLATPQGCSSFLSFRSAWRN